MATISRERQIKAAARSVRDMIPEDFDLEIEDVLAIAGDLENVTGIMDVIGLAFAYGYYQHGAVQMRETGNVMRGFRGKQSSEEVAKELGITRSALLAYERGERVPNDQVKKRIADYYHLAVRGLFSDYSAG